MSEHCTKQLFVDDISGCVALISPIGDSLDQASIKIGGVECASLFLFRSHLVGLADFHFTPGEPTDAVLLAVGRMIVANQQTVCEGRAIG